MPHRPFILFVALFFAVGLPLYFVILKRRAASTLKQLLFEQFKPRACPITTAIEIPEGGRVTIENAYDKANDGDLVLLIGSWNRGQVRTQTGATYVLNKVAGCFKPNADEAWLANARNQRDVIVATTSSGGGVVIWKGLPSKPSVLAHLAALR